MLIMIVPLVVFYVLMGIVSFVFGTFVAMAPIAMSLSVPGATAHLALLALALVAVGMFFSSHVVALYGGDPGRSEVLVHTIVTGVVSAACFGLGLGATTPILLIASAGLASMAGFLIARGFIWLFERYEFQ
jgi:hypothetical protein